jgi:phosphoribosyl 1,2-cyclic phosphodiesterase
MPVEVRFYGVRGSCPCPTAFNHRYGANTACVSLVARDEPPIVFDLGTGLRAFGDTQPKDGSFAGTALVTHMHWDHVQGFPFFPPADRPGARFEVFGPRQEEGSFGEVFGDLMRPPYFPVRSEDLRGKITFTDVTSERFPVGSANVLVRPVPHNGPTVGYRVEIRGRVVTYISDHQAPLDLASVADEVLELADGADLLIHDAQYTPEEFRERAHWGHCTVGYAVRVAHMAKVKTVVLFHHDPSHDDAHLDDLLCEARKISGPAGPEVTSAYEGLSIPLK